MAIFAGIDGGGTRTTCLLGDEWRVLGMGTAGGSNLVRSGEARAEASLREAVLQACTSARISATDIEFVCAGVAGASDPANSAALHSILKKLLQLPHDRVQVLGDMEIALEDAVAALPGVLVMAGTGSIAFGRNREGRTARAGGWGSAISDEGSGYWIGQTAVAALMRAYDNGEETSLRDAVYAAWDLTSVSGLVSEANRSPGPEYARLFPVVAARAEAGDRVAQRVLAEAGRELAELGGTVIRRLWLNRGQVRVAMGGGVLQHSGTVRQEFLRHLRRAHPSACVSFRIVNGAEGALSLARKIRSGSRQSSQAR